eukprot:5911696-Prymnesium_polylepis.1
MRGGTEVANVSRLKLQVPSTPSGVRSSRKTGIEVRRRRRKSQEKKKRRDMRKTKHTRASHEPLSARSLAHTPR